MLDLKFEGKTGEISNSLVLETTEHPRLDGDESVSDSAYNDSSTSYLPTQPESMTFDFPFLLKNHRSSTKNDSQRLSIPGNT